MFILICITMIALLIVGADMQMSEHNRPTHVSRDTTDFTCFHYA